MVNEKTIAVFTRVVEEMGILERGVVRTKEAANWGGLSALAL